MQTQSSDEHSVCPSVCLSVCPTRDLWQNETKLCAHSYTHERPFTVVLWQEEWLVGATPSTWNFGSTSHRWAKSPIFNRYSLVAPQPYQLSKKVQLTLIESPLRAFQWAYDGHRTLPLPPPQKGLKNVKRSFSVQNRTSLEESLLQKFLCMKTISDEVVRHSLANYPCKNDCWGDPF